MANWRQLWDELASDFPNIHPEWKKSKNDFGGYCIARSSERALLYLIPGRATFEAAIILGEKAATRALRDEFLRQRSRLIKQAPRCAAGRTIRFTVNSTLDIAAARCLVQFKTAQK